MKRLALLVSLALLTVVGTTATTQAYYLDTPHNESNGIYCYTCHSMSVWRSFTKSGADDSIRNRICLRCHDAASSDPLRGPAKKVHSTTTTGSSLTWTTECTQCHDVHSQGQLDWATTDSADLYLAFGQHTADAGSWLATDGAISSVSGVTTFAVTGITAKVGFDVPADWATKGGRILGNRATDGNRGLVFVPDKANPTESYEIVYADATHIKVKGKVTTTGLTNKYFGVIYGQSFKSVVMPNGGTTVNDYRNVKFFEPEMATDTAGGFIDKTPNSTKPMGLCQVCHTQATYYKKNDVVTPTSHHVGQACSDCHDIMNGIPAPAGADHTVFIGDTGGLCVGCHAGTVNAPDGDRHISCSKCHTGNPPEINTNLMVNELGSTVLGSLLNGGYTGGTTGVRIKDSAGNGIGITGFIKIECKECHESKPAKLIAGTHGGHPDTDFAWTPLCATCHSGANIAKDVHKGLCGTCHVSTSGGGPLRAGDPTNGVDGDATLVASPGLGKAAACINCHVNSAGMIHHSSGPTDSGPAQAGNCTVCHAATNHVAMVAGEANCTSCHSSNEGTTTGAPVDSLDTTRAGRMVHDSCLTCHTTAGGLQLPTGTAASMPDGGVGSTNGGGVCTACHSTFTFASHTHADHTALVAGDAACNTCHTATAGTATTVPVDAAAHTKVHDACTTCHTATGVLKAAFGKAGAMSAGALGSNNGGGACTACHNGSFASQHDYATVDHSGKVTDSTSCNICHTATQGTLTGIPVDATAHTKVHDACATCHSDTTFAVLKTAYGKAGAMTAGTCTGCHTATAFTTLHDYATVDHSGKVQDSLSCNTCHTTTKGTLTGISVDATPHTKLHDSCATCHSDTTLAVLKAPGGKAGAMTAGTCTACHTATAFTTLHDYATVDHSAKVTDTASCATCHTATKGTATGIPVDATAHTKVHDACTTCHSDTTLAVLKAPGGKAGAMTAGECIACHNGGSFTALHNYSVDHTNYVKDSVSCNTCHTNTKGGLTGVPVDATPHTKQHDSCATCHDDVTGALKPASGHAGAMPAGGGFCVDCHNATAFTALHDYATVDHSGKVQDSASCNACHTTTLGTLTGISLDATPHTKLHDSCATCHSDTTLAVLKAPGGKAGAMTAGPCTACHTATAFTTLHDYATVDHSGKVTDSVSCNTCHNTTKGTLTGIPVDATPHTKLHDSCATCHSDTTLAVLKGPGGHAGAMTTGTCTGCHTATAFLTLHDYATVDHSAKVQDSTSCNTCHTATKGTASGIPTDATLHTKVHDSCATCHSTTTLAVLNGPTGKAGAMGTGQCTVCHTATAFTALHDYATVDHSAKVTDSTNSCNTAGCHTATAGTATGIPLSVTAHDRVHNACDSCHSNSTLSVLRTASAVAPLGTPASVAAMTAGDCTGCHTAAQWPFSSHGHDHTAKLSYNATTDLAQAAPGTPCATCHLPTGTVGTWPNIFDEHKNNCATCHSYTNADGKNSPPLATNNNIINNSLTTTCITCHTEKKQPATHGGHSGAFSTTSANCMVAGCHSGADVVVNVHNNDCTLCHTGTPSAATIKIGDATFGVDGDATKAAGTAAGNTWTSVTCLTCHDVQANVPNNTHISFGGIHHNNKNSTQNNCTAVCHSVAKSPHTLTVTNAGAATCTTTCHDATITTDEYAPAAVTQPFVGTGEVHNPQGCATCHTFAATNYKGTEKTGLVKASGLNATGGGCLACHVSQIAAPNQTYGFLHHDSMQAVGNGCAVYCHTAVNHSTTVKNNATYWTATNLTTGKVGCVKCHQAGTATGMPVDSTLGDFHDQCETCHKFDANLNGVLQAVGTRTFTKGITNGTDLQTITAATGGTIGGTDGTADCVTCHTAANSLANNATMHHSSSGGKTAVGQCEYCHDDPRNVSGGTSDANDGKFQETAPGTGIPNNLPCQDCHVTPGTTTWTGNMTITSFNEGDDSRKATPSNTMDYTRATANANGHVIPMNTTTATTNRINNWGICFSCHSAALGGAANGTGVRVSPMHPKPTGAVVVTNTSCGTTGYLGHMPGRGLDNSLGNIYLYASSYNGTQYKLPAVGSGSGTCGKNFGRGGEYTSATTRTTLDGLAVTITSVPDPWTSSTFSVPLLPQNTPVSSATSLVADDIQVKSAIYYTTLKGTHAADSLEVVATTNNATGCGTMTGAYLYNGSTSLSLGSTWTGSVPNCKITLLNVANNPAAGAIVNVTTANALGYSVTGVPVKVMP